MSTATPLLTSRKHERDYLMTLNDRFQSYVSKVRQMREQSERLESTAVYNTTKALEEEIYNLKQLYERELENLRLKLDDVSNEKNQFHLSSSKNAALASEYQDKLADEINLRKKLENTLADAQRVIAEKETHLQDARITISQHQNAHLDTQKDRDSLHTALTETQNAYDTEAIARNDLQSLADQLREKLDFERQVHDREIRELKSHLADAHQSLRVMEDRLHEHNLLDDNMANMLAKVRMQSEAELRRFKEESELVYQNGLQQIKHELEKESKAHAGAVEENIHLKAQIDQLNQRIINLESKCANTEYQNSSLIQTMEVERQQAANAIKNLEEKLRTMQENLNEKIRELGMAYNSHLPLDLEIDAFATLLEAEERRLTATALNHPIMTTGRTHYIGRPVSPMITKATTAPPTLLESRTAMRPKTTARPKSVPAMLYSSCPDPISTKSVPTQKWTYVPNYVDYHSPATSHIGNVRILEVHPGGKFVRLFNSSAFQDEEIGSFIIQQNVRGKPVNVFRFPGRTKIKASTNVTVWSASSHAKHNPPSDFLWSEQAKWRSGPECTTILCKPSGQAVAWTTSAYPYGNPNYIATRDYEDRSDEYLPDAKPYSMSPRNAVHPNHTKSRVEHHGNDGRTLNAQSRSQTSVPKNKPRAVRPVKASTLTTGGNKKQNGIIRMSNSTGALGYSNQNHRVTFQSPMPA
ncbi:lamin-B1.S-like isoform X2 [Rhopilema esculentum]|uniref:lamin-B1.S-like isoform X2 n=1 Tax=Rhopilema esculentum TaxID=499914 RepID=UPI0031DF1B45